MTSICGWRNSAATRSSAASSKPAITIETADEDRFVELSNTDLAELLIVSHVHVVKGAGEALTVGPSSDAKCARCWRLLPDVSPETGLCSRCTEAVAA